ncbi:pyridoxal-phosphate dependent enzyme-domain-containing protein [Truncatella angustata]|uniref:Pyridoxal-phosphate dependent enzyme-domain-containing protein n=1 Tax=Truncatella angustata TaxID=152316 RepID=A0A9P8UNM7_9PEZI|nr:pyridoxal-phosphate dependent enzyme-domain-containing protein [Truncatella angustata]KAH6655517.1 pyridoxal-phosphate dependent enzyme-domain-containing protein [Truncatella angustata]
MADPNTSPPLTRASVVAAHELIKPFVHHTPTLTNSTLTQLASTKRSREELTGTEWEGGEKGASSPKIRLFFKCENLQRVGAFKVRGAFHAIERLKKEPGWLAGGGAEKGVVTHSSGNHAQALSLAARTNGIPAYIVMPSISPPPKISATRGYGANVIFSGSTSAEREAVCAKVVEDTGARLVPPYDHPDIVLGQGTLGLELQEDAANLLTEADIDEKEGMSDKGQGGKCSFAAPVTKESRGLGGGNKKKRGLDIILAPCGGGGMLSGVALSCEGTGIRVFGCEPSFEGADDAKRGFESGRRVETVKTLTIADGLRTPLGKVPWGVIYERKLVEGFYSVTEEQIKLALRLVLERFKMVVEPSACVPLAVALYNEDFRSLVEREFGEQGANVGIVFSGGNLDLDVLAKIVSEARADVEKKE